MIRPDVKLEDWLKKTDLEPSEYTCANCGGIYEVNVPVVSKDYFGLESEIHECGKGFTALVVTARSPKKKAEWAELFNHF